MTVMTAMLVYGQQMIMQFSVKHLMQWISGSIVGGENYLGGHRYNA